MLLLAEGPSITLGASLAISAATILLTIGGAWALQKYKLESAMKKISDNDEADEKRESKVADELKALRDQMKTDADKNRESHRELEKTMTRRLDDVKGTVTEIDKKTSVMESRLGSLEEGHREVKKKVTMFGRWSKMRGKDPDDTFTG